MSTPGTTRRLRWIEIARGAWGLTMMTRPHAVLARVDQVEADRRSIAVARVLGARHLAQAALSGLQPGPEVLALGAWVDAVHAITALGLAAIDRDRARVGLIDAAIAATWSAGGLYDLTRGTSSAVRDQRVRDTMARRVLSHVPAGRVLLLRAEAGRAVRLAA